MAQFICDFSRLDAPTRRAVDKLLRNERLAAMHLARARQRCIARDYRDNPPKAIDGVGEQSIAIDPFWWKYYREENKLAPGEDVDLVKWLKKRRAEWCVVKNRPVKMQVGYQSTPSLEIPIRPVSRGPVKYFRSYGEN